MSEERVQLCTKDAWCLLERDHDGACCVKPREPARGRADWEDRIGLRDPKGWRNK